MFLNLSFKMAASFTNVARTVSGQLPPGKIAPRLGLGFGLGLELELGSGGQKFSLQNSLQSFKFIFDMVR